MRGPRYKRLSSATLILVERGEQAVASDRSMESGARDNGRYCMDNCVDSSCIAVNLAWIERNALSDNVADGLYSNVRRWPTL
jgi:hypothetical protein